MRRSHLNSSPPSSARNQLTFSTAWREWPQRATRTSQFVRTCRYGVKSVVIRNAGDWKLWAAMALTGRVANVGVSLNYYRLHDARVTAKSRQQGLAVAEYLRVIRWLLGQVTPTEAARRKLSEELSRWISAVTIRNVSLQTRWSILRDAMAIDPHTLPPIVSDGLRGLGRVSLRKLRSARAHDLSGLS